MRAAVLRPIDAMKIEVGPQQFEFHRLASVQNKDAATRVSDPGSITRRRSAAELNVRRSRHGRRDCPASLRNSGGLALVVQG